jgi:RNA polymerase sigma-70 factor, ECF subfamily
VGGRTSDRVRTTTGDGGERGEPAAVGTSRSPSSPARASSSTPSSSSSRSPRPPSSRASASLEPHRPLLWNVAYRMTGDAFEADDVVQETFARALRSPPKDASRPLRPWLVTVAANLGRDALRRRKRRGYPGPWLPTPVDDGELDDPLARIADDAVPVDARYDLKESATYAFLIAVEVLTPSQRAVLVLRDVLGWSTEETAAALSVSVDAAKQTLSRARKRMAAYDAARAVPSAEMSARTRHALQRLSAALAMGDVDAVAALLVQDATFASDAGGEFTAATREVKGAENVAKLLVGILRKGASLFELRVTERTLNGLPALLLEIDEPPGRLPARQVTIVDVDDAGRVRSVRNVMATRKLARVT